MASWSAYQDSMDNSVVYVSPLYGSQNGNLGVWTSCKMSLKYCIGKAVAVNVGEIGYWSCDRDINNTQILYTLTTNSHPT